MDLSKSGMRFTAHGDWRTSPVTREMAALALLGFRVVPELAHDDLTGTGRAIFHHSSVTLDPRRQALMGAKKLMRMYRSGELEKADPLHPLLDSLRAMASWEALEAWRLRGVTCCLAADAVPEGQGPMMARRARLVEGVPPKARSKKPVLVGNGANAAALALMGVPVVGLVERDGQTVYQMQAVGEGLAGQPGVETAEMLRQGREELLAWDHAFLVGRQAVVMLVALLKSLQDAQEHTVITVRNRTDKRQVSILSSASGEARDILWRHMR